MSRQRQANAAFTGLVSPAGQPPSKITAGSLVCTDLTCVNTPIVASTIVGRNGPTTFTGGGNNLFSNCLDENGNLLQVPPSNAKSFFQGLVYYNNLWPGPETKWAATPQFFIGTGTNPPTSVTPTLNGGDLLMYPIVFNTSPAASAQLYQYFPVVNVATGGTFVANAPLFPQANQLFTLNTSVSPNNYLLVAVSTAAGVTTFPATISGTFSVYISYISVQV